MEKPDIKSAVLRASLAANLAAQNHDIGRQLEAARAAHEQSLNELRQQRDVKLGQIAQDKTAERAAIETEFNNTVDALWEKEKDSAQVIVSLPVFPAPESDGKLPVNLGEPRTYYIRDVPALVAALNADQEKPLTYDHAEDKGDTRAKGWTKGFYADSAGAIFAKVSISNYTYRYLTGDWENGIVPYKYTSPNLIYNGKTQDVLGIDALTLTNISGLKNTAAFNKTTQEPIAMEKDAKTLTAELAAMKTRAEKAEAKIAEIEKAKKEADAKMAKAEEEKTGMAKDVQTLTEQVQTLTKEMADNAKTARMEKTISTLQASGHISSDEESIKAARDSLSKFNASQEELDNAIALMKTVPLTGRAAFSKPPKAEDEPQPGISVSAPTGFTQKNIGIYHAILQKSNPAVMRSEASIALLRKLNEGETIASLTNNAA